MAALQYHHTVTTALEHTAVRELTGLGVVAAYLRVDSGPAVVKEAQPKEVAEDYAKKLTEAGAEAEIK